MLQRRRLPHRARAFRLEDMQDQIRRDVAKAAVIEEHAVERGRADSIEADPVLGVAAVGVADAVGFDELKTRQPIGVARLVDEIFAVHIHPAADERLAFREAEPAGHLATRSPAREVFLGGVVPVGVARERLRLDAVARRIDRHAAGQLAHEARVLVQVARPAHQLAAGARREVELGVARKRARHPPAPRRIVRRFVRAVRAEPRLRQNAGEHGAQRIHLGRKPMTSLVATRTGRP